MSSTAASWPSPVPLEGWVARAYAYVDLVAILCFDPLIAVKALFLQGFFNFPSVGLTGYSRRDELFVVQLGAYSAPGTHQLASSEQSER
jgi:hypothetical protein